MTEILIYGAGGFAREVAWLAESCDAAGERLTLCGFIDDAHERVGTLVSGLPVLSLDEGVARHPGARVALGIGNPQVRERLAERVAAKGLGFATLVHPRCERSRSVRVGEGAVVAAGCILTVDVTLAEHVQLNLDCTIGHDVVMHRFATLAPGVHVSGWVEIGARAYVGTGAAIINGREDAPLRIGDDAVVGAGAVVTRDVPAGTTVVGVPARAR